jgi:competence protein ComEA
VPQIVTATPGACTVYVVGEVLQPETMITLPCLSRVQDAIDQAGGATGSADLSRVNLGQILNDGDLVYVPPLVGEGIKTPTPNHLLLIHINYAVKEELEALPGIGPSLAQAIIDYRTEHGPFTSLEELDNIPGIGAAKINALRDQVIVD